MLPLPHVGLNIKNIAFSQEIHVTAPEGGKRRMGTGTHKREGISPFKRN